MILAQVDAKPAIITPYDPGAQNRDLAKAQERLDNSRSYKNLSTVILTPTRGGRSLTPRWVAAMNGLMRPMNQRVYGPIFLTGMEVGEAYNAGIEMVLANPALAACKYILTIEDDNLPAPDALLNLYPGMKDFDAVGALYWTKGHAGQPMIYGNPADRPLNFIPCRPQLNALQPCNGLGMGFTLFRTDVFRRLPKPWFKTKQEFQHGRGASSYTQDLYAFENMAKMGMRVACDTRVKVGHHDVEADEVF